MQAITKAFKLEDLYKAFYGSRPLNIDELDEFYLDVQQARSHSASPRYKITKLLRENGLEVNAHILFIGYKGCGKSTELNHLQKDIEDKFLVLNYSVHKELDPQHLNHIELFIVTMEKLFEVAVENKLKISPIYMQRISNWLQTQEIEQINEKYIGMKAETEAGAGFSIPYVAKFFAKLRVSAKTSGSLKEMIKRNVEPRLHELVDYCNDLIMEIILDLDRIGKKNLLIIIEDLDKIPFERAKDLFINYSNQLVALKANVIYTFPISLYNHSKFNVIKSNFTATPELPMIKVSEKDGSDSPEGIDSMKRIVKARMDTENLFTSDELLTNFVRKSGGCLMDLFLMIIEAKDNAIYKKRNRIDESDFRIAFNLRKKEYANGIADYTDEDGNKTPVTTYYNTLVALAKSKNKLPKNTDEIMLLRDNLSILGYNGEGWCDVHPIVKQILIERGEWDGQQSEI